MSGDGRGMSGTPDDERLEELLGAYALDAVDGDERRQVDELLRIDPRAAQEVDEHRETAAVLGWSTTAPPPGLWDSIAASLEGQAPAPSGELAKVLPQRRSNRWRVVGAAAIGVAAALLVVLAITVVRRDDAPATVRAAMEQALGEPDTQKVTLRNADGSSAADAVVDMTGHGFIAGATLPQLPSDRTYQLWGVIDGRAISLGVLGRRPDVAPFSAEGNLTQLVITNEVAGGVPTDGNMDGALSATLS